MNKPLSTSFIFIFSAFPILLTVTFLSEIRCILITHLFEQQKVITGTAFS